MPSRSLPCNNPDKDCIYIKMLKRFNGKEKMASFFTLHFFPFSLASTATYSLGTEQLFTGRHASGDGSLGGPWVPHLFHWDSWVGVSPVWAVGQPHACNLCVHSVVMVTQLGLVHGDWTVALKHADGSCYRKLCCKRGFYGQSQYEAHTGASALLLWTNGYRLCHRHGR